MTSVVTEAPPAPPRPPVRARDRLVSPTLVSATFVAANAVAFLILRPGTNDLWAARARAAAVAEGVGLTYWFSWFGGGSTPGNYSVLTPSLCAAIGTELTAALAAVAVVVLAAVSLRGTRYPAAATYVAAIGVTLNLWSGRVPFLVGAVPAVGAVLAVRQGRRWWVPAGLALLSVFASPVSGALVVIGLSGTFLTTRTRAYRPVIARIAVAVLLPMIAIALIFGAPGPEPFSTELFLEIVLGLGCLLIARPDDHLRTTTYVALLTTVAVWAIPNGMGANMDRFAWFCLPPVVVALSSRRLWVALLTICPLLATSGQYTVRDLIHAAEPVSTAPYYQSLAARLDKIPDVRDYRLELVNHGAYAGYDALLDHAQLARGWETQEDNRLNSSLTEDPLSPVTYHVWLLNNAVGWVALPSESVGSNPEYALVSDGSAPYLHRIWHDRDWQLFQVRDPTPIVERPATIVAGDQKSMTIQVPCKCTILVRIRYSKFLTARLEPARRGGKSTAATASATPAQVADDGYGWTAVSTPVAGRYVLSGSFG